MNRCFLFLLLIVNSMFSQTIENAFYKIPVPFNTFTKSFQSTHEELTNIDSYQFLANEKPKYIFYLISNKLETLVKIDLDNYKDFYLILQT